MKVINLSWRDETASYHVDEPNLDSCQVVRLDDVKKLLETIKEMAESVVELSDDFSIKEARACDYTLTEISGFVDGVLKDLK